MDEITHDMDVRVKPAPEFTKAYGQGDPPDGPVLHIDGETVRLKWGQALTTSSYIKDKLDGGKVHTQVVKAHHDLFMSEDEYQQSLNQ